MDSSLAGSTRTADTRRARLNKTFAYYAAFIILGLAAAVTGPTLPGLAQHVSSTIAQVSYLFVLRSLGYLVGSFLAGRLYDRVPGHPLMVSVIAIMAAMMVAVPLIPLLWLLALVMAVLGTAEGLLDVGGNTVLIWVHREGVGPFMNGLHFFFGLGAFISPIIIAQAVLATGDIYWAYWALAILMVPPALWIARLPSPAHITTTETGAHRPPLPVLIALIALFDFCYVGAEVSYGGWVYTYATALNLGSQAAAAYLTSGFWGALTAGRLAGIWLAARFSPRTILLSDLMIVVAGLAVVQAFPGSFTALWIGTIATGLGMASIFPTILNLAGSHMTITGNVTSWFFVGSSLGGMALPWIIGQLFKPVGPHITMLAISAAVGITLVLFAVMMIYTGKIERRGASRSAPTTVSKIP